MKRVYAVLAVWFFVFAPVAGATGPAVYADGVLAYTNAERLKQNLALLKSDTLLSQVAYRKMQDLFAREYFEHVSPTGEDVSDLADAAGYDYIAVGENLALGGFASSKEVVDAWMKSPGHRKNILSPTYGEIGIAAGRGMYEGRTTWIVVQSFGLPRSSCPATDEVLRARIASMDKTLTLLKSVAEIRERLLDDKDVSRATYRERVEAYNLAARLYNKYAEKYRTLIATYNKGVDAYNECLTSRTGVAS